MKEEKKDRKIEYKDGLKYSWDSNGLCFVSVPMNNIPLTQWDEWKTICQQHFSGQRWQMVWNDYTKARAYEQLVDVLNNGGQFEEPPKQEPQVEEVKDELGLLNPGDK